MSGADTSGADQLVAHRDPASGALVLTGWSPGPAGWSSVQIGAGAIELLVDHADPATLARLVVGPGPDALADGTPTAAALDLLLPGVRPEVRRAAVDLDERPRVVWTGSYGAPILSVPLADAGRLAVLDATVDDLADLADLADRGRDTATAVALAVGALESGVERAELPPGLGPDPAAADVVALAARALLAIDPTDLVDVAGWRGRLELAALVTTAGSVLRAPGGADPAALADAVDALARDLRGQPDTGIAAAGAPAPGAPPAPLAAAPAAMPAPASARAGGASTADRARAALAKVARPRPEQPVHVEVDPALDATVLHATLADAHVRATVRLGARAAPLWLRAFRLDAGARRPVLVGMAPVLPNPFGTGTATLLVPAGVRGDRLVADLTDHPEQPWRAPAVRTITRAIRHGRAATTAERRGDEAGAEASWLACAAGWAAAGDDRRAEMARRHAAGLPAVARPAAASTHRRSAARQTLAPFTLDHLAR